MKKLLALVLTSALAVGLLSGCRANQPEDLTGTLEPTDRWYCYDGPCTPVTIFGLGLLNEMDAKEPNPVISPLSAYLALAMAAGGASGNTLAQFSALLNSSPDGRDALCSTLSHALTDTAGSTELNLAQAVWTDESFRLDHDYLQYLVDVFAAEAYSADLSTAETMAAINRWVSEHTKGLIPTLLDEPLDKAAMVLINTLYFKGTWETTFDPANDGDFQNGDGSQASVPFLRRTGDITVAESEDWEGVLLPYDDGKTAFLAVKPKAEGADIHHSAAALTEEAWHALLDGKEEQVYLAMPKLEVEFSVTLNDALKALGLTDAFDPDKADFSAMGSDSGGEPLYISTVLQKVKLTVAEEGTEAAAATEIEVKNGSTLFWEEPRSIVFDSPFLYAVVDLSSETPLFLGLATQF